MKKQLIYGVAILVSLLLGIKFLNQVSVAAAVERESACLALNPEEVFTAAPPLTLPDLKGQQHRLADYSDNVLLINFWATWCPPCVEEFPSFVRLAEKIRHPRFQLLAVSVDEELPQLEKFISNNRLPGDNFTLLRDPQRTTASLWGTEKFPETYLIDRRGQLRYRFVNQRDWESPDAQACINSLLRD